MLLIVLASSFLLQLVIFSLDNLQTLSELLNLILSHDDIIRNRIVIPIHPFQFLLILFTSWAAAHAVICTLRIRGLLLRLLLDLLLCRLDLIQFLLPADIIEQLLLVYHIIAQFLHSLDQLAILLHNVVVVLSMQRRHLLQLVI